MFLEQVLSVILISEELMYFFILVAEALSINNAEIISYLFCVWGLSRGVKGSAYTVQISIIWHFDALRALSHENLAVLNRQFYSWETF